MRMKKLALILIVLCVCSVNILATETVEESKSTEVSEESCVSTSSEDNLALLKNAINKANLDCVKTLISDITDIDTLNAALEVAQARLKRLSHTRTIGSLIEGPGKERKEIKDILAAIVEFLTEKKEEHRLRNINLLNESELKRLPPALLGLITQYADISKN